jgi:hypothetical protein
MGTSKLLQIKSFKGCKIGHNTDMYPFRFHDGLSLFSMVVYRMSVYTCHGLTRKSTSTRHLDRSD